jgi:hypothetical protein
LADVLVRQALLDQAGQLVLWWPPAPGPLRYELLGPPPPGDRGGGYPVVLADLPADSPSSAWPALGDQAVAPAGRRWRGCRGGRVGAGP